ncbi:chorismate-binding protein [Candidatus Vidania fulgoroideae]|uniref:Chorismate-binding protein n=1 Tax=Candidatus Vidania fulgoroideorum TaxID=881286 RepID=A0A975ADR0_9PROT|nr:chorismate-binding protein [Candidatus Vidania fulgoroideae]
MSIIVRINGFYVSFVSSNCFGFYVFCLRDLFFSGIFSLFTISSCYSYCINITYSIIAICLYCAVTVASFYTPCVTVFNYHCFDFAARYVNSIKLDFRPFLFVLYDSKYISLFVFFTVSLYSKLLLLKLLCFIFSYCVVYTRFFYALVSNSFKLAYISNFYSVKSHIVTGNLIQCQLSKFNYLKANIDPVLLFLLCSTYDLCFGFSLISLRCQLVSFTPEVMCILSGSRIFLYPIAGTLYRGADVITDRFLSKALATNSKELAEHLMLIDLSRNDLNRFVFCQALVFTFKIVSFYYVHHIVSCLVALYWRSNTFDSVVQNISPVGTLSGAPKLAALGFISQHETPRSFYAGAVCVRDLCKQIAIYLALIRTVVFYGSYCLIRSASGIVLNSLIRNEYFELNNKLRVFLKR